jgi:hypothetical protein
MFEINKVFTNGQFHFYDQSANNLKLHILLYSKPIRSELIDLTT